MKTGSYAVIFLLSFFVLACSRDQVHRFFPGFYVNQVGESEARNCRSIGSFIHKRGYRVGEYEWFEKMQVDHIPVIRKVYRLGGNAYLIVRTNSVNNTETIMALICPKRRWGQRPFRR